MHLTIFGEATGFSGGSPPNMICLIPYGLHTSLKCVSTFLRFLFSDERHGHFFSLHLGCPIAFRGVPFPLAVVSLMILSFKKVVCLFVLDLFFPS